MHIDAYIDEKKIVSSSDVIKAHISEKLTELFAISLKEHPIASVKELKNRAIKTSQ